MLYSTIFFAASAFSGLAAAQVQTGNYSVDPNSIDPTTRADWCRAEFNTCRVLCGGNLYQSNTCTQSDLSYSCVCNNGVSPDMSLYQSTIPTFECEAYKGQCLDTNAGNITAQDQCQRITCANQTASNIISSSTSASSSSATSSSGTVASATSAGASGASSAASSASSAASTGAATAVTIGNGALVASLFGLFAYAL